MRHSPGSVMGRTPKWAWESLYLYVCTCVYMSVCVVCVNTCMHVVYGVYVCCVCVHVHKNTDVTGSI